MLPRPTEVIVPAPLTTPLDEYGGELFAHASTLFVDLARERNFQLTAAEELIAEMQRSRNLIAAARRD